MPYINFQIIKGASKEQKRQIVEEMTQTLVNILGKKPEYIHVVIQEIEADDWGFSGMLTSEYLAKESKR